MLEEMPYWEFLAWQQYFETYPYEWRDDYRASIISQGFGAKNTDKAFPSLMQMKRNKPKDMGLKASAFFQQMISAKGGDKLDFLEDKRSS